MKILLVSQLRAPWIETDERILRGSHEVRVVLSSDGFRSLLSGLLWCDISISWFAKLHALLAVIVSKVLCKKAIVVAGGDDVAYEPEIGYGMFAYWWKGWCPLLVLRLAHLVLSVSASNRAETLRHAKAKPSKVTLIYHGFDTDLLAPLAEVAKQPLAITVGGVDWERTARKGYELLVRSAALLPEVQFALIGRWHDDSIALLRRIAPENVTFTGEVTTQQLAEWFSRARVYVQASIHEGFGCSLAEAMLFGCVPVVSGRTALPEVVGDCGFYVDDLAPEALAERIREALGSGPDLGRKARERVMKLFPLEKRKVELLRAIDELAGT